MVEQAEGAFVLRINELSENNISLSAMEAELKPKVLETLDRIAFPGMTANFDAAKSAALAITLLDWREFGADYARAMVALSQALAGELGQGHAQVIALTAAYHNLLRMWIEV